MSTFMQTLNIAAYKFVTLTDLPQLRADLKTRCATLKLKGTILLSTEGINLFLAGSHRAISDFKSGLSADTRFANMTFKESLSDDQPFNRMLVKLKKEIISMGMPDIRPGEKRAPSISAQQLKECLDQGEDIVLLDTRNDYEVRLGTFEHAMDLNLKHFRTFPEAVEALDLKLKEKPIVTFCTGGIRCEKAASLMLQRGFKNVFQLEGGILNYFEAVGGAHYQGECFVFDRRVAVDANLQSTQTIQCFACLSPLSIEEQQLPSYVPDVSCVYCSEK